MNQTRIEVPKKLCNISNVSNNNSYDSKVNCQICDHEILKINKDFRICNGCKSFFKRSVMNDKKYVCYYDEICQFKPKALKKCRYCRLKSCFKFGLSLDFYSTRLNKNKKLKMPLTSKSSSSFKSEEFLKSNKIQEIVFKSLREQSLQVYIEHSQIFKRDENHGKILIKFSNKVKYNFTPEFIKYIRKADFLILKNHTNTMLNIVNNLPGFSKLNQNDLKSIMNAHFFTILGILTLNLFIDNDYFLLLDNNIQMDKSVFSILFGDYVCDVVFELYFRLKFLNLTNQEIGLTISFMLSSINYNLENPERVGEINEYYSRALIHEFNSNKRTKEFMQEFKDIVCLAPKMNQLCMDVQIDRNENYSSI